MCVAGVEKSGSGIEIIMPVVGHLATVLWRAGRTVPVLQDFVLAT